MKIGIIGKQPENFPALAECVYLNDLESKSVGQCCIIYINDENFPDRNLDILETIESSQLLEVWAIFLGHRCEISDEILQHLGANFVGIRDDIDFTSAFGLAMWFRKKSKESFEQFKNSSELHEATIQSASS